MQKIPFLRDDHKSTSSRDWQLLENDQGCIPVEGGLCLQMEKSPPPLPQLLASAARKAAATPPSPKPLSLPAPPKKDPAVAFLEWMIARSEKKQQKIPEGKSPPKRKQPQPFDLYDLPAALKTAGFPIAAKLSQKWLDGRAYTAYGPDGKEGRYDSDMVDTETISLNWLRGHDKIEKRYQALLGKLNDAKGLYELRRSFNSYLAKVPNMSHELNTRDHCQGDWQEVHARFQFQLESVGMLDTLTDTLGMTDVTAAVANFAFYAAVGKAHVQTAVYNVYNTPNGTQRCSRSKVQISHVWVYAKDRADSNLKCNT